MKTRKQMERERAEAERKTELKAKALFWTTILTPAALFTYFVVYTLSALADMLAAVPK